MTSLFKINHLFFSIKQNKQNTFLNKFKVISFLKKEIKLSFLNNKNIFYNFSYKKLSFFDLFKKYFYYLKWINQFKLFTLKKLIKKKKILLLKNNKKLNKISSFFSLKSGIMPSFNRYFKTSEKKSFYYEIYPFHSFDTFTSLKGNYLSFYKFNYFDNSFLDYNTMKYIFLYKKNIFNNSIRNYSKKKHNYTLTKESISISHYDVIFCKNSFSVLRERNSPSTSDISIAISFFKSTTDICTATISKDNNYTYKINIHGLYSVGQDISEYYSSFSDYFSLSDIDSDFFYSLEEYTLKFKDLIFFTKKFNLSTFLNNSTTLCIYFIDLNKCSSLYVFYYSFLFHFKPYIIFKMKTFYLNINFFWNNHGSKVLLLLMFLCRIIISINSKDPIYCMDKNTSDPSLNSILIDDSVVTKYFNSSSLKDSNFDFYLKKDSDWKEVFAASLDSMGKHLTPKAYDKLLEFKAQGVKGGNTTLDSKRRDINELCVGFFREKDVSSSSYDFIEGVHDEVLKSNRNNTDFWIDYKSRLHKKGLRLVNQKNNAFTESNLPTGYGKSFIVPNTTQLIIKDLLQDSLVYYKNDLSNFIFTNSIYDFYCFAFDKNLEKLREAISIAKASIWNSDDENAKEFLLVYKHSPFVSGIPGRLGIYDMNINSDRETAKPTDIFESLNGEISSKLASSIKKVHFKYHELSEFSPELIIEQQKFQRVVLQIYVSLK